MRRVCVGEGGGGGGGGGVICVCEDAYLCLSYTKPDNFPPTFSADRRNQ